MLTIMVLLLPAILVRLFKREPEVVERVSRNTQQIGPDWEQDIPWVLGEEE